MLYERVMASRLLRVVTFIVCLAGAALAGRAALAAPGPILSHASAVGCSAADPAGFSFAKNTHDTAAKPSTPLRKSLHHKGHKRGSAEPGQTPLDFAASPAVRLVPLAVAAPRPPIRLVSGVTLDGLPPRAPPASPSVL
jgi:hypothetical protein